MEESKRINQAVKALTEGQAVIFPTDTVYGLGVAVGKAATPEILYDIKQRDYEKPLAWLVGEKKSLTSYGVEIPSFALVLAQAFWPGPLTLVVKAGVQVPKAFRSRNNTIALRMSRNETALELIKQVGAPLATTSANVSGEVAPQNFWELSPQLVQKVSVTLQDDTKRTGTASTVIDCTGMYPEVLRKGDISLAAIQALI